MTANTALQLLFLPKTSIRPITYPAACALALCGEHVMCFIILRESWILVYQTPLLFSEMWFVLVILFS